MTGTYNLNLVFASYCVAVIAAFSAVYFSGRVRTTSHRGPKSFWFTAGAICLGTGVWSMHFVGMSAYEMPMEMGMSFNFVYTAGSLLIVLLASALGLWVIAKDTVNALQLAGSSLVMGLGIFTMHYMGMYAMMMSPAPTYDSLLVALSGLIAVCASGAALIICRNIEQVPRKYSLLVRLSAALVMGVAICGMHYTGMFAVSFPTDATMASDNSLRGDWMGIPTAVAASVFLLLLLYIGYQDYRELERIRLAEKEVDEKVARVAFLDTHTGLPNRSSLEEKLTNRLELSGTNSKPFALVYFELSDYRQLSSEGSDKRAQAFANDFSTALKRSAPSGSYLARYKTNGFVVLLDDINVSSLADQVKTMAAQVTRLAGNRTDGEALRFRIGYSHYPQSGTLPRMLIRQAQVMKIKQTDYDAGRESALAS